MSPIADDAFDIIDIARWTPDQDEPSGENEKTWFRDPDNSRWIFKPNRILRSPHENSAELIASLLAAELGIPAAMVRLASLGDSAGCVSRNVVADEQNHLEHGSVFISELADNFDPRDKASRGHSLSNITAVLDTLRSPLLAPSAGLSAREWFAGYLLFDALIGNRDRHSENWAVEITANGIRHLAPSFDHATSLGIVVRHGSLAQMIRSQETIGGFADKAYAHRYEGQSGRNLVEVAADFLAFCSPAAREFWATTFKELRLDVAAEIVLKAKMSSDNTTLAIGIINHNYERIAACLTS